MLYLHHVFGKFTLQTGTVLCSTLFITLAVCVFFVNVLSIEAEELLAWSIMFFCTSFMVTTWIISFKAAYEESYKLISITTVLWTIYLLIWIILIVVSIADITQNKNICLQSRCPDVLWLSINLRYKSKYKNKLTNPLYNYGSTIKPNNRPIYEETFKPQSNWNDINNTVMKESIQNTSISYGILQKTVTENFRNQLSNDIETGNLGSSIMSIVISGIYILMIILSWIILNSYRKEIKFQSNHRRND